MSASKEYIIDRIMKGKEFVSFHSSVAVVHHEDGKHYSVFLYDSRIAIGRIGEMPFMFQIPNHWDTMTTKNWLRNLGFSVYHRNICIGRERNPETNRMRNVYERRLYLNGSPTVGKIVERGDLEQWYGSDGTMYPLFVQSDKLDPRFYARYRMDDMKYEKCKRYHEKHPRYW